MRDGNAAVLESYGANGAVEVAEKHQGLIVNLAEVMVRSKTT